MISSSGTSEACLPNSEETGLHSALRKKSSRWDFLLRFIILVLILLTSGYLWCEPVNLATVDLGRHISNGRLLFSHPQLLYTNFYSYTEPDFIFVNHHWLSGLVYYIIHQLAGWLALSILNYLVILASFSLSFWLAAKKSNFYLAALFSIASLFLLSERIEIRPETFSGLFLMLYWCVYEKYRQGNRRLLLWLIPVQLLWTNMHIYSFLGILFWCLVFADRLVTTFFNTILIEPISWQRRIQQMGHLVWSTAKENPITRLLVALVGVSLLSPNHLRGFLYPFNILREYGYEVVENKSIFYIQDLMINHNILIFKWLLLMGAILLLYSMWLSRKWRFLDLSLFLFFAFFGCFALRNISIVGLVLVPVAAHSAYIVWQQAIVLKGYRIPRLELVKAGIVLSCMLIVAGAVLSGSWHRWQGKIPRSGIGLAKDSDKLGRFLLENDINQIIFNNYDIGSYLDFYLAPNGQVFVDNRPEAFSVEFFHQYRQMQTDEQFWKEQLNKYGFRYIVFTHTDGTFWAKGFLQRRLADPDWPVVYIDPYTVVFIKASELGKANLQPYSADELQQKIQQLFEQVPLAYKRNVADLAEIAGFHDLYLQLANELSRQAPDNFQCTLSLASALAGSDSYEDWKKATALLEQAIKQGAELPSVYNQLGVIHAKKGDYSQAQRSWETSLEINPNDEWAQYYLAMMQH